MDEHAIKTHARKAMAEWISAMADNVGNPVAGIRAAVGIIEKEFEKAEQGGAFDCELMRTSLEKVVSRLESLSHYVVELRDFSRPIQLKFLRVDPAAVIEEALKALPASTLVEVRLEENIGVRTIEVDPTRVAAILSALVANGLEAVSRQGTPRVRLTCAFQPRAFGQTDGCRFVVEDNGPGIPAAEFPQVLEPFFSTKDAGTGLGMAIAQKYTRAHGGRLELDRSEDLGGLAATVDLPVEAGEEET